MQPAEYARMAEHERTHFWFVATRTIVLRALSRFVTEDEFHRARILDLGCGTGYTLGRLREAGHRGLLVGADVTSLAVDHARRDHPDAHLVCASATDLPFHDSTFDVVLALDVLEHVLDDHAAAQEMLRVVRPDGVLVLTVPAFRFLWSDHDEALHHVRRYRREELRRVLTEAGLRVKYLSYCNTTLFAPIAAVRVATRMLRAVGIRRERPRSDVHSPPDPINAALRTLLSLEQYAMGRTVLPFGVSLLAVASPA